MGDVVGTNQTYILTLTVSDGVNTGQKTIEIIVNNRLPYQIFSDELTTYTYTPLLMPDVFTDDDGENLSLGWVFEGGVNLDGVEVIGTMISPQRPLLPSILPLRGTRRA